jgi:DNA-binding NarL/FixJ family response regulator
MKRVVVVDGHERIRELLVELLSAESDVQVVAACASSAEGPDLVGGLQPDVVVLDPDLLGPDVVTDVDQIVRAHPGAHLLVLTAAPHGRLAAELVATGARTCLSKSVAYSAILRAVRSA